MEMGKFQNALENFEKIISMHSYDLYGDDAIFYAAKIYDENLKNKEKANELYQSLLVKHPGSIYTAEARKNFRKNRGDQVN
jgi:tetratricopeptide (TPR) repeat protein